MPFALFSTIVAGYTYEIIGRRETLAFGYLCTAVITIFLPHTAPDLTMHLWLRCLFAMAMAPGTSYPLVNDYIIKKDRGKAIALSGIGIVFGELFAMGVLLKMTEGMSYNISFAVIGVVSFLIAVFFWVAVENPPIE